MNRPPRAITIVLGLVVFGALWAAACVGQAVSSSRTRDRLTTVREALRSGGAAFADVERMAREHELEVSCPSDGKPCPEARIVGDVAFSRRQYGFVVTLSPEGRVDTVGDLQFRGRTGKARGRGLWRDAP